ncbi:hypothetical protein CLAIMM_14554 [Cladophialophora immunda]|nr:hypothetical protein CLAIMM_14554 [Cladophialophora immunda]
MARASQSKRESHPSTGWSVDANFIRAAVNKAGINALRMALYQVTADPDLALMKVTKQKIRGGALFDYVLSEQDMSTVREKAVKYLVKGPQESVPEPPTVAEATKLMNLFAGVTLNDRDILPGYEELAYEEFPRGVQWTIKPSMTTLAQHKVVIIGAGLSGIAAAIQLKRLGVPYIVYERQKGVGGTWFLNQYPECRVDTLSYLFQYKFEKNYPWASYFASREENQRYIEQVSKKYGVFEDIRFQKERSLCNGKEAQYTRDPDLQEPNVPHNAVGHSVPYQDKNVAVIGTGSTGTQLVPGVARSAKSVTVYQRTPNWIAIYEGYNSKVDASMKWLCDNMPYYWHWYGYAAYFRSLELAPLQVRDHEWRAKGGCVNERNDTMREGLTNFIKMKFHDRPDLVEKLTPKYAPLIRRLVVDNGFYDTLKEPHVELVTEGIDRITSKGILTKDGIEREFDLIVLGAGFEVGKYFYPIDYVGKNGTKLSSCWEKDGARSYLGMVIPGFPNLFSLYGPNHQPRGGSLFSWAEIWARYAVKAVVWMIENNVRSLDVKQDVFDEYQIRLDERTATLIWEEAGAGYYVNEFGRQGVNMPWTTSEYHEMIISPNPADFEVDYDREGEDEQSARRPTPNGSASNDTNGVYNDTLRGDTKLSHSSALDQQPILV